MSAAFWNAFWVFVGIVAGAFIQFGLSYLVQKRQRRVAIEMLRIEAKMNVREAERFFERVNYIRDRVCASQLQESDMFISFRNFDYSVLAPLMNSGHFYDNLGQNGAIIYYSFMRFFNVDNARYLTDALKYQHDRGQSLDFLDSIKSVASGLTDGLRVISDEL